MTNPELSAADKVEKVNSLLRAAGAFGGIDFGEIAELTQFVSGLPAEVERLKGEADRLNKWADGFSDAQLKERATGEAYQQELRAEIARLQGELAEAKRDTSRLDYVLKNHAFIAHARDGDCCWLTTVDEEGDYHSGPPRDTPRFAIDASIAKDSQP